jgi:HSP20 family molecular chaperone IbpA
MTQQAINQATIRPHLCEPRKFGAGSKLPLSSIHETAGEFQIEFNLLGAVQSSLYILVSLDRQHLYVLGKKELQNTVERFQWIFELPYNVNPDHVSIDRGDGVYLIHVPKRIQIPACSARTHITLLRSRAAVA